MEVSFKFSATGIVSKIDEALAKRFEEINIGSIVKEKPVKAKSAKTAAKSKK